jgi:hypothetical protein
MAVCIVLKGVAHRECLSPRSKGDAVSLVNWALSAITNQARASDAIVTTSDLQMLVRGRFTRPDGAIVTFGLPAQVFEAVDWFVFGAPAVQKFVGVAPDSAAGPIDWKVIWKAIYIKVTGKVTGKTWSTPNPQPAGHPSRKT